VLGVDLFGIRIMWKDMPMQVAPLSGRALFTGTLLFLVLQLGLYFGVAESFLDKRPLLAYVLIKSMEFIIMFSSGLVAGLVAKRAAAVHGVILAVVASAIGSLYAVGTGAAQSGTAFVVSFFGWCLIAAAECVNALRQRC